MFVHVCAFVPQLWVLYVPVLTLSICRVLCTVFPVHTCELVTSRIPQHNLNFMCPFIFVPVCVCWCAISGCLSLLQRAAADVWSWPVNAAGSDWGSKKLRVSGIFILQWQTDRQTGSHFSKRRTDGKKLMVILGSRKTEEGNGRNEKRRVTLDEWHGECSCVARGIIGWLREEYRRWCW